MTPIRPLATLLLIGFFIPPLARAADYAKPSPETILKTFAGQWDESTWRPKRFRGGYMRPLDDKGWRARMTALHQLVAQGKQAVPALERALKNGKVPERILAAQALGYLAPHASVDVLLTAAKKDSNAAVRLYAVDSIGMQGKSATKVDWDALAKPERNRDVKKHIRYAKERKGKPVKKSIVEELAKWNPKSLNTAVVGKPAPPFTATTAQGKTVKSADFKGKSAIVLVFIYGDT